MDSRFFFVFAQVNEGLQDQRIFLAVDHDSIAHERDRFPLAAEAVQLLRLDLVIAGKRGTFGATRKAIENGVAFLSDEFAGGALKQ